MKLICPSCENEFEDKLQSLTAQCPNCAAVVYSVKPDENSDSDNETFLIAIDDEEDFRSDVPLKAIITGSLAVLLLLAFAWILFSGTEEAQFDTSPVITSPVEEAEERVVPEAPIGNPKVAIDVQPSVKSTVGTITPSVKTEVRPQTSSSKASQLATQGPIVTPRPPELAKLEMASVSFGGRAVEVIPAAAGRCLLVRTASPPQVQVIDVVQKTIVASIPAGDASCIAADLNSVYLFRAADSSVSEHRLSDGKLLSTRNTPKGHEVLDAVAGVGSRGPLFIQTKAEGVLAGTKRDLLHYFLLHPESSKCEAFKLSSQQFSIAGPTVQMRASESGCVMALWCSDRRGGLGVLEFDCDFKRCQQNYFPDRIQLAMPRDIGAFWVVGDRSHQQSTSRRAIRIHRQRQYSAVGGSLQIRTAARYPGRLQILNPVGQTVLLEVTGEFPRTTPQNIPGQRQFTADRRIHFAPHLQRLAVINNSDSAVGIAEIDLNAHLKDAGRSVLAVTSAPPTSVVAGSRLSYDIQALCAPGTASFHLDFAPDGATLSKSGRLQWSVPLDAATTVMPFVVSVRGSNGQHSFHSFTCFINPPGEHSHL